MQKDKTNTSGRKSKYETHVEPRLAEIEAWCRDGLSEKSIAAKLGVSYSTFRKHKKESSALFGICARTRAYVDDVEVVPAYLKRVTGYDVTEVKKQYSYVKKENGEIARVLVGEIEQTRHIPGDARAAEFWLTNRQPEKWKRQPEASGGENEYSGGMIEIPAVIEKEKEQ